MLNYSKWDNIDVSDSEDESDAQKNDSRASKCSNPKISNTLSSERTQPTIYSEDLNCHLRVQINGDGTATLIPINEKEHLKPKAVVNAEKVLDEIKERKLKSASLATQLKFLPKIQAAVAETRHVCLGTHIRTLFYISSFYSATLPFEGFDWDKWIEESVCSLPKVTKELITEQTQAWNSEPAIQNLFECAITGLAQMTHDHVGFSLLNGDMDTEERLQQLEGMIDRYLANSWDHIIYLPHFPTILKGQYKHCKALISLTRGDIDDAFQQIREVEDSRALFYPPTQYDILMRETMTAYVQVTCDFWKMGMKVYLHHPRLKEVLEFAIPRVKETMENFGIVGNTMGCLLAKLYHRLGKQNLAAKNLEIGLRRYLEIIPHNNPRIQEIYGIGACIYREANQPKKEFTYLKRAWGINNSLGKNGSVCNCQRSWMEERLRDLSSSKKLKAKKFKYLVRCSNPICDRKEKRPREFQRCERCKVVFYCSRKCQKKDWKSGHKRNCASCQVCETKI